MSNIEKICQEIERQRSFIEGLFIEGDNSFYDGQDDAYNHLLASTTNYAFIAGEEYQKEQMMKEAVESEVVITSGGILLRDLRIEDFDYEDKVKIIIVKKDE